jgi:hypothetical protein
MPETEVQLEEVKEEQKKKPSNSKKEDIGDVVDIIQPKIEPVQRTVKDDVETRKYTQRPLSFFGKLEFFSLIGDTVDVALQTGLTVNTMLEAMPASTGLSARDFSDVDSFVLAISKLMKYAPDLLRDCYCVWLNVPIEERAWAKQCFEKMSDEEGIDIIETFIDQNAEAIENFFRKEVTKLWSRVQRQREESSQSSSNSNHSRQRTRKQ